MKIKISKAPPQNGLNVEGGKYETLSSDGINLLGDYHKNGGLNVSSNGQLVEAERNEPIFTGSDGSNYVFGNVTNPFSGKLFKNEGRDLLKEKGKQEKNLDKANTVIEKSDPHSKFGSLDFNTGKVQLDSAQIQVNALKQNLDGLANVQETILSMAEQTGADPKNLSKQMKKNGGKIKVRMTGIPQAKNGTTLNGTQEAAYQNWRGSLPKNLQSEYDYDLRGLYQNNPNVLPSQDLHFPDTYKLPNHPTFSNESQYYMGTEPGAGGYWQGDNYTPNPRVGPPVAPMAKNGISLPNLLGKAFQTDAPVFPWTNPNVPATPQGAAQAQSPVQQPQPMPSVNEWLSTSTLIPGNEGYAPKGSLAPSQADPAYVRRSLEMAAQQEGVDPNLLQRLSFQESGFRPGVKGVGTKYGTAYGHVQFLPKTAKQYGISEAQLKSNKPEDVDAVSLAGAKHLKSLITKYNGDTALALAEYNGGQGAINDVRKGLGKQNITGQDAINYWQGQNTAKGEGTPNLYRNQTLNYVNNILNTPQETFYGDRGAGQSFRQNYYNGQEGTTPEFQAQTPEAFNQMRQQQPNFPLLDTVGYKPLVPITEQPIAQPLQSLPYQQQVSQQMSGTPAGPERNTLTPLNYLGEIAAILDTPDYVQGQQFNPVLMTPYRISLQDQINQNTGSFNAIARTMANNPEALATLQGQKYQQDQSILGNEFRQNQGIQNQILNQNNQILNQAQLTNNQYGDLQYQRQAAAQANTDTNRQNALNSISAKYSQNDFYNNERQAQFENQQRLSNMYGNLYQNYQFDPQGNVQFQDNGGYEFNYVGFGNQDQSAHYRYLAQQEQLKKQAKVDAARNVAQKAFGFKFK